MIAKARRAAETRAWPRYYPARSILATLMDGEIPVARGVVSNISVAGARVIANAPIGRGRYIRLNLRERKKKLLETDALILWNAEAVDSTMEVAGVLQGMMFTHRSPQLRKRMEKLLVAPVFMDPKIPRPNPSFATEINYLAGKREGKVVPPAGDEFDRVKEDLLRDFESLFSSLREV
jgi:hypothetical protein